MNNVPRIGVVICTCNRRESLLSCLESLARQTHPAGRLGVWIYDDLSSDGTGEAAAAKLAAMRASGLGGGEVIRGKVKGGIAAGRNEAARRAAEVSDRLLFVDDDVLLNPDCAAGLAALMASHPETGIAGPLLLRSDDRRPLHGPYFVAPLTFSYSSGDSGREAFCDWVDPACIMVSPAAFFAAGGFWPGYYRSHEGVDLCLRAGKAGFKVLYSPSVSAVHLMRKETLFPDRLYYLYRNKFLLMRRNAPAWHRLFLLPVLAAVSLPKYLLVAVFRHGLLAGPYAAAAFCAVLDGVLGKDGQRGA